MIRLLPRRESSEEPVSVLFDAPGPRARARNRIAGLVALLGLAVVVAFVVYRFAVTGQFSGRKWEIFLFANVQRTLLQGLLNTLTAAAVAAVFALIFGAVFAAARLSDRAWLRGGARQVVELFRAIPLLILIFFFYYASPELGIRFSPFWAVVLGLTLYNGSVLAEIFRAGIAAVPRGQSEAAYAIGLRKGEVLRIVLFPQALRAMLPTVISQLVVLLKDTALGFLITFRELLTEARQLTTSGTFEFPTIPVALVVTAVYVAMCLALSALATYLERRARRVPRSAAPTGSARESETVLTGGG